MIFHSNMNGIEFLIFLEKKNHDMLKQYMVEINEKSENDSWEDSEYKNTIDFWFIHSCW